MAFLTFLFQLELVFYFLFFCHEEERDHEKERAASMNLKQLIRLSPKRNTLAFFASTLTKKQKQERLFR
jgi:hypothetical protein